MFRIFQSKVLSGDLDLILPQNFALRSLSLAVIGIACLLAVYSHVMIEVGLTAMLLLCMLSYPLIFLFYVFYLLTGYVRREFTSYIDATSQGGNTDKANVVTNHWHLGVASLLYVNCLLFYFIAVKNGADPLVCYIPLILTSGTLAILNLKTAIALIVISNLLLNFFTPVSINKFLSVYLIGGQFVVMLLFQSLIQEVRNRALLEFKLAEAAATQSLLRDIAERETKVEVARNLHDEIGHLITLIIVNLNRSIRSYKDKVDVPPLLVETHALAKQLMVEIRRVVFQLRNENSMDLKEALSRLTTSIRKPNINVRVEGFDGVCSASTGEVIFRACQEAITNSLKHSTADNIEITLKKAADNYQLTIVDDGAVKKDWQLGQGLRGLKERVEDLMGSVWIESDASGFKVNVELPC